MYFCKNFLDKKHHKNWLIIMRIFLFFILIIISFVPLFINNLLAQVKPNYETLLQKKSTLKDTTIKYYLALDRIGKAQRVRFYAGDEIEYRVKGEKFRRKNDILGITDDGFLRAGGEIKLAWVERVWTKRGYKSNLPRQAQIYLPIAGALFVIADLISSKEFSPKALAIGGGMALAGVILRVFNTKRYFIGKNTLLKSIEAI